MNEKINFDINSFKIIYARNKGLIFPTVIIFLCVLLFFQFVIPQFNTLFIAQKEVREATQKIEVLKENLNLLANTDENSLDSQFRILNLALPAGKDFSGVLNSIYYASQKIGASLGSFSFRIGDLSKSEKNEDFSTISLVVPVNAGAAAVNSFVETLAKSVPLSHVSFIKIGENSSSVNISFYYKPLGVSAPSDSDPIIPISQKGISLVNELNSFGNISSF